MNYILMQFILHPTFIYSYLGKIITTHHIFKQMITDTTKPASMTSIYPHQLV